MSDIPSNRAGTVPGWLKALISRYWGVAGVLLLWQGWVTVSGVNSIVLPQPLNVLGDIVTNPAIYLQNGGQTLALAAAGLVLGMALGTLLAILAWSSRLLSGVLIPLCLIFSSVPVVAMIPVLARLLGYDIKTVMGIVVVISFFPAFIFTAAGLKSLPSGSADLFAVLGAKRWARFIHLVLPSAVPNWMVAFRLAAPPAVLAAMLAEFLMGKSGLGYLFRSAAADFQTERAFGTSVIATVISVICFSSALAAEKYINDRWK
jgi:NitT/TauT family transport system permease protein